MTAQLAPTPIFKAFDNNGNPLFLGQLFTYEAGTTTPQATYTDSTESTPNTNPVILNSRGECNLWLDPLLSYKLILKDSLGNQIWAVDNINGSIDLSGDLIPAVNNEYSLGSASFAWKQLYLGANGYPVLDTSGNIGYWKQTAAEIAASVTPTNYAYAPGMAPRYGVIGDGVTNDTAAMQRMLSCSSYAVVPFGYTPLINSALTIRAHCALEFQGGYGNANSALPGSYLIMSSSMTSGAAITLLSGSTMRGGGVVGTSANLGGGIVIAGNGAELDHPFVQGTGGDGIRVGTSGGANCNSFRIVKPVSLSNSGKGISIHDGNGIANANCNAGQIDSPFVTLNGSHGLYLGHCWWVTVINVCSESNTGYGVYCDGTDDTGSVPICRYPNFIGGDANEGNTAGQWYDQSYFGVFINADGNNVPSQSVGSLAGSGERTVISSRETFTYGMTVNTVGATYPLNISNGTNGGMSYDLLLSKVTTGSNGDGIGLAALLNPGAGAVQAGAIRWQQVTTGKYSWVISSYNGSAVDMLVGNANSNAVYPATDNALSCGASSNRWSVVYAVTGTINTSDAATKTEIEPLSDKEKQVAIRLKGLVRRFKFKDAVAKKGNGARLHVGLLAQDVESAFAAEGLKAEDYGMFCRDETPDGPLAGVRYEELLAFVVSAT